MGEQRHERYEQFAPYLYADRTRGATLELTKSLEHFIDELSRGPG